MAGMDIDVTEQSAADLSKSASPQSGQPQPPAANQGKDEPFETTPDTSAQASDGGSADDEANASAAAGSSSLAAGDRGDPPRAMEVDDVRGAANTAAAAMPAHLSGGVPTPGDSQGVSVPAVQAASGSSEQSEQVDGVNVTALAPPGKPDGEVDTRG
jgi:hypothetical protein